MAAALRSFGSGSNGDDFDLRAVLVLAEKSVNVAVNQADDSDAKRGVRLLCLGECGSCE